MESGNCSILDRFVGGLLEAALGDGPGAPCIGTGPGAGLGAGPGAAGAGPTPLAVSQTTMVQTTVRNLSMLSAGGH
jgi:hypothetical protein